MPGDAEACVCVDGPLPRFDDEDDKTDEGESENAERRMRFPKRVEGRYTLLSPEEGKLGPAARPERRLTSSRPVVTAWISV